MKEQNQNDYHRAKRKVNKNNRGKISVKRRNLSILFLIVLSSLLFLLLIARLVTLQVVQADELSRSAIRQMTDSTIVFSPRGMIKDRKGEDLVANVSKSRLFIDGNQTNLNDNLSDRERKDREKNQEKLQKRLPEILNVSPERIAAALNDSKTTVIANGVSREMRLDIEKLNGAGLIFEDYEGRYYPGEQNGAGILGFTNREGEGQYGIERQYDRELRGVGGRSTIYRGVASGNSEGAGFHGEEGLDILLTLSLEVQNGLEAIIQEAKKAHKAQRVSAIVEDVRTGEIIAMATTDTYDPNNPREPLTEEERKNWDQLGDQEKEDIWYRKWNNFNVSGIYEPGSVFKTITMASALEENTTNPKKHYYCSGYIRDLPGVVITCSSLPNSHGDITMDNGFALSCNPTFVNMGRDLGKENFYRYIKGFGFGENTGIDLPAEAKGIIPESDTAISDVELATISYGHGIAVTPIQMINAISAAVNGGYLMRPHVVGEMRDSAGRTVEKVEPEVLRQVISEETSKEVCTLLEKVVLDGTGKQGKVSGYRVGGKTGTAQRVSDQGGYIEGEYNASFVSVAPIDNPRFAVLVIVEDPKGNYYGGSVAAPISAKIMKTTLDVFEVPKSENMEFERDQKVIVPDVRNLLLEDAGKRITESGLKFNMDATDVGEFSIIREQAPQPGTEVDGDTIIELKIEPNDGPEKKMPNFMGSSKEAVETVLKKMGLSYEITGEGTVTSQTPQPGRIIQQNQRITIILGSGIQEQDSQEKPKQGNGEGEVRRED